MKRALVFLVCFSIIFSITYIPGFTVDDTDSETIIVNKIVSKNATAEFYHSSGVFSNPGYEAEKMLDGENDTFGYGKLSGASGHLAVIDLGGSYDITKISINFPQTDEIQTAIDALSTTDNEFKAKASDANMRSVVVLSNTKPATSMIKDSYTYTGEGKVVCDGTAGIKYSKSFEDGDIEDGKDYRYIGIWTPYSWGVAISEINVWADVAVSVFEPMEMHFSTTEELTGDGVTEFGIGQLYYNGRIVNEADDEKAYKAYVASYKNDVLKHVEVEKIVVKPNSYTDVSIPIIHKIGMDTIKGFIWDGENGPVGEVVSATRFENEYDPLFDGSILSMTPKVYDAKTIIEDFNKTAETPLPLTGISSFENVDTIFYDGIKYQGETRKTFAYVAVPEGASAENPVPGVVLVHGKGGTAYDRWAKAWADKGYAAISIDTDGRMNVKSNAYGTGSSARIRTGLGHQENVGYSDFTANESKHSDMWFYQAISDAVLAGNLLRSLPEVDASKIGITGVSYGSVITMKAIGVDNRFSFAAPVYGGGYGWESPTYWRYNMTEERKAWDPIMFLKQSGDIPVLWFVTNRDQHFGLEQISKTYVDEEVFDKANMIILNNFSHLDQLGTIIDTSRDGSNGHYLTEKMQKSITDAMIGFAKKAFGEDKTGLSKVSRLTMKDGAITATVTLPDGVTPDGATAKFRYLTVANYNDLYVGVPGRETQATMWVLQADGVTLGTESSSNSPWPVIDAVVDGTNISVTVPENATYGFVEYFDSRGILTTSELIKIK